MSCPSRASNERQLCRNYGRSHAAIRSERRLCEEVHHNLAYRWFCRLGLEGKVPDHSTFSENRHGRFRESDTFRHLALHLRREGHY